MKKIGIIALLLMALTLAGCKQTPDCKDDEILEDGVCIKVTDECPVGQEKVDGTCVDECQEGFERVDGVCQEVIVQTPLEEAFENTIDIDNYKMVVSITEADTTANIIILNDGNKSSIAVGDDIEYYDNVEGVCHRYTEQLGSVVTEDIDCIENDDTRYKFFHGFNIEWFNEQDGAYALNEGNYALVTNFFRTSLPDATVSNFVLDIDNGYFSTFSFDVTSDDVTYHFVITLSEFNEVELTIPS